MKTDKKIYARAKKLFAGIISLSIVVVVVCLILYGIEAAFGAILFGVLFAIIWLMIYKEYQRHLKLMKEHEGEDVQTIIKWLVHTPTYDKSAYLEFLDNNSVNEIARELELFISTHPKKEFQMLYQEIKEKI